MGPNPKHPNSFQHKLVKIKDFELSPLMSSDQMDKLFRENYGKFYSKKQVGEMIKEAMSCESVVGLHDGPTYADDWYEFVKECEAEP